MWNSVHRAGALSQFYIGSLRKPNSVENTNSADTLQKNRKQFACIQKGSPPIWQGSCLNYTSFFINCLLRTTKF